MPKSFKLETLTLLTSDSFSFHFGPFITGVSPILFTIDIFQPMFSYAEITGTPQNDTLFGTSSDDVLNGLAGDDEIDGLGGNDILNGGDGDDCLIGGAGADVLNGGAGSDTLCYYSSAQGVAINLMTGTARGGDAIGDSFTNMENIYGSTTGDNILIGDNGANRIDAGNGDDVINGNGGDDILDGAGGDDNIEGGGGNDYLNGGAGHDTLNGGGGDDILDGYLGIDTVVLNGASIDDYTITDLGGGNFTVTDNVGTDGTDTLYGIEYLRVGGVDIQISQIIDEPVLEERTIDEIAHYLTDEFTARQSFNVNELTYNITGLSAGAQVLAIKTLQAWANVSALTFTAVTTGGHIVFTDDGNSAVTRYQSSGGVIESATINIGASISGGQYDVDSYFYQIYLHEIGHALGLGHAGPYNRRAVYNIHNVYQNDSWAYTVMSYFDQSESNYFGDLRFVLGPQIADIVAIQDLYGGNTETRNGDTVYGFNSTETDVHDFSQFERAPSLSIFDTGGVDTLDFSGYSQDQIINLNAESFSSVNGLRNVISIARDTVIENVLGGSGNDIFTGNAVDNYINGGSGDDYIYGSNGADIIEGGNGNDTVNYGASTSAVTVDLSGAQGSGGFSQGDTYFNIENVIGSEIGDDILIGNSGENIIDGRGGDDILRGGAGNDILRGGAGNDDLYGEDGADIYVIDAEGGSDQIFEFEDGVDHIEFRNNIYDYSQLKIFQQGNDVVIFSGYETITLLDFDIANLSADDFIFRIFVQTGTPDLNVTKALSQIPEIDSGFVAFNAEIYQHDLLGDIFL